MKVILFDAHRFERETFEEVNRRFGFDIDYFEPRLTPETAGLAKGFDIVCSFANDKVNADTLVQLKELGIKLIALRSAGFNHVDLGKAHALGIPVCRVPAYSPYAVAEHAMCLLLALNRKIHKAYNRVREGNFSLEDLVGFDLHGKTVGVIGTGKIGSVFCKIANGFGCHVVAYDPLPVVGLPAQLVSLEEVFTVSDIISLHCPLTPQTKHLIDGAVFAKMKKGAFLINTGRGALIDTKALIQALKSGQIGGAGLDVYEEEEGVFFNDLSSRVLQDDTLARLLTFPNVLLTSHQAFLTKEALHNIAETTLGNIKEFMSKQTLTNEVSYNRR